MRVFTKGYLPILYTVILSLAFSLASCEPVLEEPPVIETKGKTVVLYMVANNNLSGNAQRDLSELKSGYIPEDGNLLVYFHTVTQSPVLLHIYKGEGGQIMQDTTYRFPNRNSASHQTLTSVLKVAQTLFPANQYGLILWSHGTGWLPSGYYSNTGSMNTSACLYGDYSNYPNDVDPFAHMVKSFGADAGVEMEITDLAKALPSKFEFVIFDACLMGGIETFYELKDSVNYVIASPTEILTDGFPYSEISEHMFSTPVNAKAIAAEFYEYYNNMSNLDRSATIAAVNTSELNSVAAEAKIIFDKYRNGIQNVDIQNIQRYYRGNKHWFFDLGDFISQLAPMEDDAFKIAMDKAVIYKAATDKFLDVKIDPLKFSGVSTYIPLTPPDNTLNEFYKKFKWNIDSGFIQ